VRARYTLCLAATICAFADSVADVERAPCLRLLLLPRHAALRAHTDDMRREAIYYTAALYARASSAL